MCALLYVSQKICSCSFSPTMWVLGIKLKIFRVSGKYPVHIHSSCQEAPPPSETKCHCVTLAGLGLTICRPYKLGAHKAYLFLQVWY